MKSPEQSVVKSNNLKYLSIWLSNQFPCNNIENPNSLKIKFFLVLSSLALVVGYSFALSLQHKPLQNGKTKFIVIKNAFFNRSNIYKPNAALLITDIKEITENEDLFFENRTYGHACGYHYAIQFWASPEDQLDDIAFNQECEEFLQNDSKIQTKMKRYIKQLETNPTHYIYNLKIPVTIDPKDINQLINENGLYLFFMNGTDNHHTTLGFSFEQVTPIKESNDRTKWIEERVDNEKNAIIKINEIVDSLKAISTVISQSEISFPMQSFGGGKITHKGEISLKFKNGTDLKEVKEIIERNKGKVGNDSTPQHYFIQLVDNQSNLDLVIEKLKKFKFVTAVYEYPKTN